MNSSKVCPKCHIEKELIEYNKNKYNKDGVQKYCRECQKVVSKADYEKHVVTRRIQGNKHYAELKVQGKSNSNPETVKRYYKEHRVDIIEKAKQRAKKLSGRFSSYKSQAKRRGIKFEIDFQEFLWFSEKPCFYCKSNIEGIGIDRFNNTFGYIFQNLVSCCYKCNWMKRHLDVNEFLSHCKKITANFK